MNRFASASVVIFRPLLLFLFGEQESLGAFVPVGKVGTELSVGNWHEEEREDDADQNDQALSAHDDASLPTGALFYSASDGRSNRSRPRPRPRRSSWALPVRIAQVGNGDGNGNGQKEKPRKMRSFSKYFPAATYSSTPQGCSTIGPEGLSCRVRNGIGRFPPGITTGKKLQPKPSIVKKQTTKK